MTKHIFVTGGVVSSLGKGLTSASIGMLLESRGLRVRMQKLDPYINVDPGTMSPYQHGEVYVLDDGSETDLDLGHYERFTNGPLTRDSNYTTGQIYLSVIEQERKGAFLGKTVQVIPHITNEIKRVIRKLGEGDVDVVITEIGGTVGDIESQPFLEAIRQFSLDVGKEDCLYIHLTLVPYLRAAGELKTKPTQHSVGQLRQIGIQPDILVCRTERSLSRDDRDKIALFCNIRIDAVIEEKDKDFSIYEVPLSLVDNSLDELIVKRLQLPATSLDLSSWRDLLHRLRNPAHEISIAVVGKYARHSDAYKSIYEALDHAGMHHQTQIRIGRIQSEHVEREGPERLLSGYDGVLVPGGFGERGIEGKIEAIRFARERNLPFPIWIRSRDDTRIRPDEDFFSSRLLDASILTGSLLCDGIGDLLSVENEPDPDRARAQAYNLLQGARARISKTEVVACPSCGRTLFDLQTTTRLVKASTAHLKGITIAVMGCIVNGPGEMADADFGYVGTAPGKIDLYVGKNRVESAIPEHEAVDRLVDLIKEEGKWTEP